MALCASPAIVNCHLHKPLTQLEASQNTSECVKKKKKKINPWSIELNMQPFKWLHGTVWSACVRSMQDRPVSVQLCGDLLNHDSMQAGHVPLQLTQCRGCTDSIYNNTVTHKQCILYLQSNTTTNQSMDRHGADSTPLWHHQSLKICHAKVALFIAGLLYCIVLNYTVVLVFGLTPRGGNSVYLLRVS